MRSRNRVAVAIASAVLAAVGLAACSQGSGSTSAADTAAVTAAASVSGAQTAAQVLAADKAIHSGPAVDASNAVQITLTGGSATGHGDGVDGNGAPRPDPCRGTYPLT